MNTFTLRHPRLGKSVSLIDLRSLGEAFRHLENPRNDVLEFRRTIRRAALKRAVTLGADSELLDFSVNELAPIRTAAIAQHLVATRVDARALDGFLDYVVDRATEKFDAARTGDQIGEAVIDALDDLHAYVLSHRLVAPVYLDVERRLAERLDADDDDEPEPVGHDPSPSDTQVTPGEDSLALAA